MHPFLAFLPTKERERLVHISRFMTDEESVQFSAVLNARLEEYVRVKKAFSAKLADEGDSTILEIRAITHPAGA